MECPVCGENARHEYNHPEAEIYRCQHCDHAFTNLGGLSPEAYNAEYFQAVHKNWFENPNFALFESIYRLAVPYGEKARVLDVGCGRCDLLIYLKSKNAGLQLTGIDLAPPPSIAGIELVHSSVFDLKISQTHDLIASLAVIEHVDDIRSFVAILKQFAHERSTIAIMTLNEGGIIYAAAKALRLIGIQAPFNRLYSKHHLHHYTVRSLRSLMEKSGLTIISHTTHNFPLAAVDFPSQGLLKDFLQKVGVAVLFAIGRVSNRSFLQTIVCKL